MENYRNRIDEQVFAAMFAWADEPVTDDLFQETTKHDDVVADELAKHVRDEQPYEYWPRGSASITAANWLRLTSLVPDRSVFVILTMEFAETGLMLESLTQPRAWLQVHWSAGIQWEGA